jgi:hypothetical protein
MVAVFSVENFAVGRQKEERKFLHIPGKKLCEKSVHSVKLGKFEFLISAGWACGAELSLVS